MKLNIQVSEEADMKALVEKRVLEERKWHVHKHGSTRGPVAGSA